MSYFIFDGILKPNQPVTLEGEEALHLLNSRRIHPGEEIEIQDANYQRFQAKVNSVGKKSLLLQPLVQIEPPLEPTFKINLFQALIKDKPLELVLQKATELGVATICLFQSTYSQRLKKEPDKQLSRWRKICVEACKQSGRTKPPALSFLNSLADYQPKSPDIPLIQFSTSPQNQKLNTLDPKANEIELFIGPEGGWQSAELEHLQVIPINLGLRVLRSETAAIAAVSIFQYLFGDMSA